jgi:pyruvate dehydrogenase E2 component (dihydrolipoamide acetyltransferase)
MEEGTILAWLVEDGALVKRGDELVEIETDKASMVHHADAAGVLQITAQVGATLPVGAEIGKLLTDAEPVAAEPHVVSPEAEAVGIEPEPAPADSMTASDNGRIHASPVARRVAREKGVDLAEVEGSGPHGRIIRADVEAVATVEKAEQAVAPDNPPVSTPEEPVPTEQTQTAKGEVTRREPNRAQALIARRMAESRATVPDFTLQTDVDAGRLVDIRAQLKEQAGSSKAPTVNDLVVKACALSLKDHPAVNGAWRDGAFEEYARVNIGVAVATDDGLVVPVIFDADRKDVHQIAAETQALAGKARDGSITPPDLSGGTFSVSNLGMFGVDTFTAVVNPPQAAILSVGRLREVPVVHDGEVVPGHVLTLTLAVDHRAVYGAPAAKFLESVRDRLAAPAALLG